MADPREEDALAKALSSQAHRRQAGDVQVWMSPEEFRQLAAARAAMRPFNEPPGRSLAGDVRDLKRRVEGAILRDHDPVQHPSHYTVGGIEVVDYIRAKLSHAEYRGYLMGSAHKYLGRAPFKGRMEEDLRKAKFYLDRLIELTQEEPGLMDSIGDRRIVSRKEAKL